jgi:hypothetical protein
MNPTKPEQIASPELATMSEARRRLIRAGLASGPVVATLASPSVFAADCVAPSQTLSAAKSHTGQLGNCGTLDTADTWKSKIGAAACPDATCTAPNKALRDTSFHGIFTQQSGADGCRMYKTGVGGVATPMTFGEVLDLPNSSNGVLIARQFVAAYLNIMVKNNMFPVGGITSQAKSAQAIVDMWTEWASKSSFTPYAGAVAWDGTKVSYYLTHFAPM